MSHFSPTDAALEGLRVMRREPRAMLDWIAVWAVAFAIIAVIQFFTGALRPAPVAHDEIGTLRRFGPLAMILAPTVLGLWVMTTATVYRAVLRPGEHGWHLFKLGSDEARIGILLALETVLLALLGGAPEFLLLTLLNPIFLAAPGLNWIIAFAGFVATIFLEFWIAVRFSLAPVQTFAEQRFPFSGYWGFTRGRFWRLLLSYLIVIIEIVVFLAGCFILSLLFGALSRWIHGMLLLALVPVLAVLSAIVFVVPSILICACQAYAYRAIAAERAVSPA